MIKDKIISFDDERLIVVDEQDRILDHLTKKECHKGDGILHRAFSIFIFNERRELLVQKRSLQKLLWPNFWSNSCCSHPRQGETTESAARRRLIEELGIKTNLIYLYSFQYHARFERLGSERELCAVFIGNLNDPVSFNPNEIAELKFVEISTLAAELRRNPDIYTPWFKMEWERLSKEYLNRIHDLFE